MKGRYKVREFMYTLIVMGFGDTFPDTLIQHMAFEIKYKWSKSK